MHPKSGTAQGPGVRDSVERAHGGSEGAQAPPSALAPDPRPLTPKVADPCVMVVFGGRGDLARRKLLPALYNLVQNGYLGDHFAEPRPALVAVGQM